ncbi:MAG: hypothetical protein F4Y04_05605 [Chloroflexi bacterium]|nr:hypothetical protein [Chloroflexota bacterium]
MSARAEATAREIAAAANAGRVTIRDRAAREAWPYREIPCAGHPKRIYPVASLPIDIQRALGSGAPRQDFSPGRRTDARARSPGERGSQAGPRTDEPAPALPPSQEPFKAPSTTIETPLEARAAEDAQALRWERLPEKRRARAEAKLASVDAAIAIAEREGLRMPAACDRVTVGNSRWSSATLLAAWRAVRDLPRHRRAMALADRWEGRSRFADCDPEAWQSFKADYLRAEAPTLAMCGRTLRRLAAANGWTVPASDAALRRRLEREVSLEAITLARRGPEALKRMRPAQIRDREALAAMEIVCADGHRFDVLVLWPDGRPGRPVLVAWQDVRSGKILGWRIGREETAEAYRLSLADLLWKHGAPDHVIVDNGRGIASKALTGGSGAFRGKDRPGDPVGLLTALVGPGNIHWTIPYSGQSKPIERAFRDMASDIARDTRLAGAYTGKDTVSKPHNYGSRAVPLEEFRTIVADGIEQHNARRGRRGAGMQGRSCDEVFEATSAGREPKMLAPHQLARWLLAAEGMVARASDGAVTVHGTRYWCEGLAAELAGKPKERRRVVVRYDPEDLARPVQVEMPDGRVVGRAEPQGAVAYLDAEAAKRSKRAAARALRARREELDAHRATGGVELVELPAGAAPALPQAPAAEVPQLHVVGDKAAGYLEPDPELSASDAWLLETYDQSVAVGGGGD